jgi:NAD(P)-dependent dehydrogenase (short-subunit alcohol dehydrogenase family)
MSGAVYPDLAGVPVLVTGGASGIGQAIVAAFAAQRARVAAIDIDPARLALTASRIETDTGTAIETATVDLRDVAALRKAVADLATRTGAFRVLVNNAGDDARHKWHEMTPELWDERFAVNARHQFFAAQAVAPAMGEAGGGAIVNLGSISWMFGAAGLIAYTTAKSAIMGLTKSLARELGTMRIRVNSIAPGWVLTEKQVARANAEDPAKFKAYLDRQCLKEHLEPDDVARLALWLASTESRRCTGQTFVLDAGVV